MSEDYAAVEFMSDYQAKKSTAERQHLLAALINRVDARTLRDAVLEARRGPVSLINPKNRHEQGIGIRPYVGVGVFVFAQGMMMLQKRISKIGHGHGQWSLAGGHQEYKQSIDEAAAAELKQEFNLEAKSFEQLCVTSTYFEHSGRHYDTVFVIAQDVSGVCKNMEPDKSEGAFLFPYGKWQKPVWEPLKDTIKAYSRSISALCRKSEGVTIEGLVPYGQAGVEEAVAAAQ